MLRAATVQEPQETFLSPEDLVERWNGVVKPKTLANWRTLGEGHGPTYVKIGNRILYPLSKVLAWEAKRSRGATREPKK